MLTDLIKSVDQFCERYSRDPASQKGMKDDLMELVEKAINHGADKDQGKIAGIAMKALKGLFSKSD